MMQEPGPSGRAKLVEGSVVFVECPCRACGNSDGDGYPGLRRGLSHCGPTALTGSEVLAVCQGFRLRQGHGGHGNEIGGGSLTLSFPGYNPHCRKRTNLL